jgi:hypothetical protein
MRDTRHLPRTMHKQEMDRIRSGWPRGPLLTDHSPTGPTKTFKGQYLT